MIDRILFSRITGLCNRGVDAQMRASVDALRARLPAVDLAVLTDRFDYDRPRLDDLGVRSVFNRTDGSWARRPGKAVLMGARVLPRVGSRRRASVEAIAAASVVVALGGDVFSSDYKNDLYAHLAPLRIAHELGRPTCLLAHTIGPFTSDAHRKAFIDVARGCRLIAVRDEPSLRYCVDELQLDPATVQRTADPAFLLRPLEGSAADALLGYYGIGSGPTVALALSQSISGYSGLEPGAHLDTWSDIVDRFLAVGAQVVLVPHVQQCSARDDDRSLATRIARRHGFDPRIRVVGGDHDGAELKTIIGACDLAVGERMHATIAAFSSGVPAFCVSYSVKTTGLVQDIYPDPDAMLLATDELASADGTWAKLGAAWEARDQRRAQVADTVPALKALAEHGFDALVAAY